MKPLPPYTFIAPNASAPEMGAGFVLQTAPPHYLGRVVKLKPYDLAVSEYVRDFKPLIFADIPGYSIVIAFAGTLPAYKIQVRGPDWEKEIQGIYNQMADWYEDDKINHNPGYYKRFKIN